SPNDLVFNSLATVWDEAVPLGNAIVGSLVWQKDDALRMSLDHVGLWDLRQMINGDSLSKYNFKWVESQVLKKDYRPVQLRYDVPYDTSAFPSKIPGGALEFDLKALGKADSVRLYLRNAVCEVRWNGGARLQTFVHATENAGWFRFAGVPEGFRPVLVPPVYQIPDANTRVNSVNTAALGRLGYPQGTVEENGTTIVYHQPGNNGFYYEIAVSYRTSGNRLEGVWTVRPKPENGTPSETVAEWTEKTLRQGFAQAFASHGEWWTAYWAKSSVNIPDATLAKQYDNEMYKFGSAARSYSPPISLQAVWTADDGKLPPWKGDFHHDLNTQLSYWPCYAGNRLDEGLGYLNWLWETMPANRRYAKEYFGAEGLAVPGVATLEGEPMAGWCQYSMSPTVSAWLSQHFYLHWLYSQDRDFLKDRAYPYLREVAVFLDNISVRDADSKRKLPISASPEIYDNSLKAWFPITTNYDLALIRFVYTAAEACARELGLDSEAGKWRTILSEWTSFDLDEDGALTFVKGFPYNESHRHFSHQMAIHPLGLIDRSNGETDRQIIDATIRKLDDRGPGQWCGYSYSWLGNVKARNMDGEGAAEALKIFAEHFCLPNTFHANGDQTKQGYSNFTYRPFTLEGNFAFAAGIHEMLIQSHTGVVRLFPAIPASWKDVSFERLRTVGAFLVSAQLKDGNVSSIAVESEKGGILRLAKPGNGSYRETGGKTLGDEDGVWTIEMNAGEKIKIARL
ncbi:MAG: hypothetical protein LBS42_07745, partial [Tannerella sp.]|nr:hypothetical protein [Tannerella sp.]